jgi:protein-S-isoprenylcysteine O-methyltransferase Ste14
VPPASTSQAQAAQQDPDTLTRIGGWLFKKRTSLPLPVVAALLLVPQPSGTRGLPSLVPAGVALVALGELIRLWGVHHIGAISRTRSDRLGPLVDSGPFARVRNPLYVGNVLLWLGFTISARLVWLAPIVVVLLGLEYHAIVKWEERLLEGRMGQAYRDYMHRVPRWLPKLSLSNRAPDIQPTAFSWSDTLFSERGTIIAIAAGYILLGLKARLG